MQPPRAVGGSALATKGRRPDGPRPAGRAGFRGARRQPATGRCWGRARRRSLLCRGGSGNFCGSLKSRNCSCTCWASRESPVRREDARPAARGAAGPGESCGGGWQGGTGLRGPGFPPRQVSTQLWICCHRLLMILLTPLSENKFFTPHLVDSVHRVELCQKKAPAACGRGLSGLPAGHGPLLIPGCPAGAGCSPCT